MIRSIFISIGSVIFKKVPVVLPISLKKNFSSWKKMSAW